ncbi:MAG: type II toxin-antitoxin system antitoxin SocA domain-containing protein [Planctomycetaceae bacterium]
MTVSVFDVTMYVLKMHGKMTHMKLQKLVYYCQAWSLVWDEQVLFKEKIEAWANGPVVPQLFAHLRTLYLVGLKDLDRGDSSVLSDRQKETIQAVLNYYGDKSPQWLSDLTHLEDPWKETRNGLPPGERSKREITHEKLAWYYGSL